jgi:glucose/arabinose dehydrogenase
MKSDSRCGARIIESYRFHRIPDHAGASEGRVPVRCEVFAEGWLQGQEAWGCPVDIIVMPDGALLVSDDRAGVIYRISYKQ